MQVVSAVIAQVVLLVLALAITFLRCFVRIKIEARALTSSDYLIWGGWFFTLAWTACQCHALYIEIDHPITDDYYSDSEEYLKTVFASCFFFDVGLYFPKASITAFYWWLIPVGFRRMRIALYICTAYLIGALVTSILTDLLICRPISDNWSLDGQMHSIWNSYADFTVEWALNMSTDIILFVMPFFVIKGLQLRQRQKVGLVGVFSLGLVTMTLSLARFIVYSATDYNLSDADGAVWCTAEMCTALIVASLPGLKALIMSATRPGNSRNRSNNGYLQTSSHGQNRSNNSGAPSRVSRPKQFPDDDSEIELVMMDPKSARGQQDEARSAGW